MLKRFVLFCVGILSVFSCANGARTTKNSRTDSTPHVEIDAAELGIKRNSRFIISNQIDLAGKNLILPDSVTLVFQGGLIYNGKVTGDNTMIETTRGDAIFNKVRIDGTWLVPEIRTSMFCDIGQANSLRDVFALGSPTVANTIYIEEGDYMLAAHKNKDICLTVCSNTKLIIDGNIKLLANDYPRYDIICVQGENIVITGKGSIVGDKKEHTGTDGEWGMGIRFHKAVNSSVSGLTIKNCWGDCIYVGGNSKNVTIEGCTIDGGRRQGISITKADSVTVRKCEIANISGTKPEYAIDLEPNQGDTIGNVLIENVNIKKCVGGILTTKGNKNKRGKNAYINRVDIKNCSISGTVLYPIRVRRCNYAIVEGCIITSNNSYPSIFASEIENVTIYKNHISFSMNAINEEDRKQYESIYVSDCGLKSILKNRIVNKK